MAQMTIDVWLYGVLSRFGGEGAEPSHAHLSVALPEGSTMGDLLAKIGLPTEERGITFISAQLSAMPGLQPDLVHVLVDGDRVGLFDLKSMWPFQYRHGAAMIKEMQQAVAERDGGLHHDYEVDNK